MLIFNKRLGAIADDQGACFPKGTGYPSAQLASTANRSEGGENLPVDGCSSPWKNKDESRFHCSLPKP